MDITGYELFQVPPRCEFVKLETDEGTVGWGETYAKWHMIDGSPAASGRAVDQLMEKYVLGSDPLNIERLFQRAYRATFFRGGTVHMSAWSAIDQALWDIKGRHYDAPVYDLLGGKARDRIRVYVGAGPDSAHEAIDNGFTAIKYSVDAPLDRVEPPATAEREAEKLREIREAVGSEVDVGVDFHGRVAKSMADRLVSALEPYEPMFVEEPLTPEYTDEIADIANNTDVPIATGERLYSRWDFRPLFERRAVDIIQPDIAHVGITEQKKIADVAETYDVALSPHSPNGPIAHAASMHVDIAAPNFLVQEQRILNDEVWQRYLKNPEVFEHDGGYIDPPEEPGLGLRIDEDAVRAATDEEIDFQRPDLRRDDGSVAEW